MALRVLIMGGTGQVGAAVMRALSAEPYCAEVVMVNRKAISLVADPRVREVVLDTATARFPAEVAKLAQSMVLQGDLVYGASSAGIGKGGFARGAVARAARVGGAVSGARIFVAGYEPAQQCCRTTGPRSHEYQHATRSVARRRGESSPSRRQRTVNPTI